MNNTAIKKIILLLTMIPLFTSAFTINYFDDAFAAVPDFSVDPKSLFHLRDDIYLLIFQGCTGSKAINTDEISIVSDTDKVSLVDQASEDREIPPNECPILEVLIHANDPYSISIEIESLGIKISIDPDELSEESLTYHRADVTVQPLPQTQIRKQNLSHIDMLLTEKQLQECESVHDDYSILPLKVFSTRYLYHNFMGDCVLLFDDPIWEVDAIDRYDQLAKTLEELKQQKTELMPKPSKLYAVYPFSVIESVTEGSYIFTFEACAGKYPIGVGDVMVSSDTEVISLIPEKQKGGEIPPSVCKVMHINIKAEDPNSINIFVPHKSPRAQMKQGIPVQDVVCKEGLELIKKTRDGSAACVSEYAASKLVERGWGEFLKKIETLDIPVEDEPRHLTIELEESVSVKTEEPVSVKIEEK